MHLMQYDSQWFRIGADAVYSEEGKFSGYWPGFSTALVVSPDQANTAKDTSIYGWVPGGTLSDLDEALKLATATARVNWDAIKAKRPFRPDDQVGHRSSLRKGRVIAPPAGAALSVGHALAEFAAGKPEEVPLSELIFMP